MAYIAFKIDTITKLESVSSSLNIKAKSVQEQVEKLCDKVLEQNKIIKKISGPSEKSTLSDLFKQLYYLEKKTTKKEVVLFFILRETHNKRTVFMKSIMKRLSRLRSCTPQEAQNIARKLKRQGFISIIKKCPKCGMTFNSLPNACKDCGHLFILQKVSFKDKRLRPRSAIEITNSGKKIICELIVEFIHINSFFKAWIKYISLK